MARKKPSGALFRAQRNNVRSWMGAHAHEHVDPRTGELNHTGLAEAAAVHFDGQRWLYDETHWIWDLPFEVAEGVLVAENPGTPPTTASALVGKLKF